jgi:DnaJ-class molecular chaperone
VNEQALLHLIRDLEARFRLSYCHECKCTNCHEVGPERCGALDLWAQVDLALHRTCPTCRGTGQVSTITSEVSNQGNGNG